MVISPSKSDYQKRLIRCLFLNFVLYLEFTKFSRFKYRVSNGQFKEISRQVWIIIVVEFCIKWYKGAFC